MLNFFRKKTDPKPGTVKLQAGESVGWFDRCILLELNSGELIDADAHENEAGFTARISIKKTQLSIVGYCTTEEFMGHVILNADGSVTGAGARRWWPLRKMKHFYQPKSEGAAS